MGCTYPTRGTKRDRWPRQQELLAALAVLLMGVGCSAPSASATISVAIIDYQDTWSTTRGLGQTLSDLGQSYTDLTARALGGQAINLAGYDTFIVGSMCTQNATIRTVLVNAGPTLNQFVNSGGTVIMLTQADQNVAEESWVQPPARVVRGDPDFSQVRRVQPAHQLFSVPETIVDADLGGWQYLGSATWPTSWESFVTFQQVGVLAGDDPQDVTLATILEAGWGDGRALFLSLALDKARNVGNAAAEAAAPRLMRNLLQYANDVQDGTVADIVIYQGGGWPGPITGTVFNDLNGDGDQDGGEPGIAGVGVSDTIDLVLTAADGSYTLPNTAGDARLLYICPPAGYAKGGRWYERVNSASDPSVFSFALTEADESGSFDFIQVSDIHVGGSGNKPLYIGALARIAALKNQPAFILATGDLVNTGANLGEYDDYAAAIATSQVPLFNVFGNHDANSSGSSNYRKYLGPDYYAFDYGDCHFLIVNSVHKTAAQQAWVDRDLQLLRGDKRLFIFQHYSPSEQEHTQFSSWSADAVFSGHWHSQHTVPVSQTTSYNSGTLLFGGIDCSPAGFKIIHVDSGGISTHMKWIADGKRLQIVTPANSLLIAQGDLPIIVNAYETSAEVTSVTYQVKRPDQTIAAQGVLSPEGDWTWKTVVPALSVPRGDYSLEVTATNDRDEMWNAATTFTVLAMRPSRLSLGWDWPQFGGGPARGGAVAAPLEPPLGPVWARHTGGTLDFASPVLKDDTVYIGVKDRGDFEHNGVMALGATDGSVDWFTPTPAAVSHSVAVDANRVYACSHGGILHGLDRATGQQVWSQTLGSTYQRFQYAGPLLFSNRVFAGTFAWFGSFNPADGAKHWNQNYGGDWISCNACPAGAGNLVLVPANWSSQSLKAVNISNGAVVWSYTVQGLHGSPVVAGNRVVFTDYNGQLHCADLATGQQRWQRPLGGGRSASTPAVAHGIVVAGGTGSIRAFDLAAGGERWNRPIGTSALKMAPYNSGFAALVGSPTIADRIAYVPCGDGGLYALNLDTGDVLWSMDFGAPLLSAPCISGNVMFITAYDGHVYALAARGGFGPIADLDGDGDVDQSDYGILQTCFTADGEITIPPECEPANLDGDVNVDQADAQLLMRCLVGSNLAVDFKCMDASN